ncbi:MAG: cell wall hydrolase [Croceibacterium sp.]
MTAALGSTMAALLHDPAAIRRLGLLAVVTVALPVCVAFQAASPREGARAATPAKTATPASALPANNAGIPALLANNTALILPAEGTVLGLPAKPFFFSGSAGAREQAVACLAAAAWYEAGNNAADQRSVMQVVLNRVAHPSFPKSVCGVVLQGSERKTGCQFTFTCDGSLDHRRPGPESWAIARARAEAALNGAIDTSVLQATHYHADYVAPWWSFQLERLSKVGRHIFYRWPGARGTLAARPASFTLVSGSTFEQLGMDARGNLVGRDAALARTDAKIPHIDPAPVSLDDLSAPAMLSAAVVRSRVRVMALDDAQPIGRWAIEALRRCSGEAGCHVIGYAGADLAARNAPLSDSQRDLPQFVLIRDASSGQIVALWDCDKAQRPDASQCLPSSREAVRSLMRERAGT